MIIFSGHAKDQIKRRRISISLVKTVVRNPEQILPSFRDRELRRTRMSDRILEVVTKTEDSDVIIVTAYYLKEETI